MFMRFTATLFALLLTFSALANENFDKGFSAYKTKDYTIAFSLFTKAANQGHANAQHNLGVMYDNGEGVKKDDVQAVAWYRKAANQGHAHAQHNLGFMYDNGEGVKKDYVQAVAWYRKAANQGHAYAQSNLGFMYSNGKGVTMDDVQAVAWYRKAANQGHAPAQSDLGFMYDNGKGVTMDDVQAVAWYRKAANQGHVNAQYNLAIMYNNGKGITKDDVQAFAWYRKAANQGHVNAQYNLGVMYANGKGVKKDDVQAVAWYRKAANQGHVNAQYNLANAYQKGKGVKKDLNKALALFKKSNTEWSKKRYLALDKILNCDKTSKTKLFNVNLKCADRDTLMVAAKKAGADVKDENKQNWGDKYLTSSILKGSSELFITYTIDDLFAQAKYTFPSHMDAAQVSKVQNFVANKYGNPDIANGNTSLGEVAYKWNLEDGIELKVHREWPNTTTYLTYTYPENNQAMIAEQTKQENAREAKQYETQDNAF